MSHLLLRHDAVADQIAISLEHASPSVMLVDRRSNDRGALDRHSASRIFSKEPRAALAGKPRAGQTCFWAGRRPLSGTETAPEACAADSRASRSSTAVNARHNFTPTSFPPAVPLALSTALATE